MSAVPKGSIVQIVVGDAQTTYQLNPNDVLSAVSAELNAGPGGYSVRTTSQSGGFFSTVTPLIQETFQATINLQTLYDTTTDNITADVAQAFGDVTGYTVAQITIPTITPPGGSAQATGQPAPTPTTAQTVANAGSAVSDAVSKILSGLSTVTIVIVIGAVAIGLVVLILYVR